MIEIITHDRVFHADDVFACAILKLSHSESRVVRTRDSSVIQAATGAPNTILVDIGGQYDPELRLFDHHQPDGAGWRKLATREWPYASAGLIWKHYGDLAVRRVHAGLSDASVAEIVEYIDEALIKYIDAVDCGVRVKSAGPSLSGMISSFNPAWYEEAEDVFPLVLDLAQVLLTNFIKRQAGKVLARDTVRKSQHQLAGRLLVLESCLPWTDVVSDEMPDVLFVVYPIENKQWQLRAAVNSDMTPRVRLPQTWAGLERKALTAVSGVDAAVFCHRSRHLAGADDLPGAMALVEQALRSHDNEGMHSAA